MDNELLDALGKIVNTALAPINSNILEIRNDVLGLKDDVKFIQEQVVLIEQEHGKKLGALSDGYTLVQQELDEVNETLKEVNGKIDRVQIDVGVHDLKLDKMAK